MSELPLYRFNTLPSTNQKLWELLDAGLAPPVAVVARQQTAGKGQWGRQWQSEPGGLYFSLALSANLPAQNSPHLTFSSAWGLANALRNEQIPVLLKWPNDLLLAGRKLGGILSETRVRQGKIIQAVVGVGINWRNRVPATGINLQTFFSTQRIAPINSLEQLSAIALKGVLTGYQYYQTAGIDALLLAYYELLNVRGRTILIDGYPGTVVGIAPGGELRIRLDSPGAGVEVLRAPGTICLGYEC